jgi:hypothetical protein
MTSTDGIILGTMIGYLIGQILVAVFTDEIFAFLDRARARIRNACGLH